MHSCVWRHDGCNTLAVQDEIEGHRSTLDPDNPRDLIDSYLLEMEEKKDDLDTTCSGKFAESVQHNHIHFL